MTARIDASDLPPDLAKKLGVRRTNARKRAADDGGERLADDATRPEPGQRESRGGGSVDGADGHDVGALTARGGPRQEGTGPAGRALSRFRCAACHADHTTWGAAERHARTTGHARIDLALDLPGDPQP